MKISEIGSNFFLTPETVSKIKNNKNKKAESQLSIFSGNSAILTANGSLALKLALEQAKSSNKKALLPNFLCDSIVDAFQSQGFEVDYYPLNPNLSPNIDELNIKLNNTSYSVLFLCSLFGFNTSGDLYDIVDSLKGKTIIIEDITHSLYSKYKYTNADYFICSLRKWNEIPDGGALLGSNIDPEKFDGSYPEATEIVSNFVKASNYKYDYFNLGDKSLKTKFREYYVLVDVALDALEMTRMSSFSRKVMNSYNIENLKNRRRKNYMYLAERLLNNKSIEIIFPELPEDVVPLYMPIYVKNGKRDDFQRYMAKEDIYCTFHWPVPEHLKKVYNINSLYIQKNIVSLVIDQRYTCVDMAKIVKYVNAYSKLEAI